MLNFNRRNIAENSILFKILNIVIIICSVIMIYSAIVLYYGIQTYITAREYEAVGIMAKPFSYGLKNFMFERGRVNVVLASEDPVSHSNRDFISSRKEAADTGFTEGLKLMEVKYSDRAQILYDKYDEVKKLRIIAVEEMKKPLESRDPDFRGVWFEKCTQFIDDLSSSLKTIGEIPEGNDKLSDFNTIIADTLNFRSIVGKESSIITSALSGCGFLSKDKYDELMLLRGKSSQIWIDILEKIEISGSDVLKKAADDVNKKYYEGFRPFQDGMLDKLRNEYVSQDDGKITADLSVDALNSIFLLADRALEEITRENENNLRKGYMKLGLALFQLLAGIFILIFIPVYIRRHLIRPMNEVVNAMETFDTGNLDKINDYRKRKDEIGKLAVGVKNMRDSMVKEEILKNELKRAVTELEKLSSKDFLTDLYNRRYTTEKIHELEKTKSEFVVIIADIDHFKDVNDLYGHDCGDHVLNESAQLLKTVFRKHDILARWGGEEFLIIMPDVTAEFAAELTEEARRECESMIIPYYGKEIRITMTFGIAAFDGRTGVKEMLSRADMAMYEGKKTGRNKVITAGAI